MNDLTPCQSRVFRDKCFQSCDDKSVAVCITCGHHICASHMRTSTISFKAGSWSLSNYRAPICDDCAVLMVGRAVRSVEP